MDLISEYLPEMAGGGVEAAPVPDPAPKKKPKAAPVPEPVGEVAPVRKATAEQVENLVALFHLERAVKEWSYERAALKLTALSKMEQWARNRARSVAAQVNPDEGCPFPKTPHWLEDATRADAATAIEEASADAEQLYMAVAHAVWCLNELELRKLAKHFVTKFKPCEPEACR